MSLFQATRFQPRWYLWSLGFLFVFYLGGWGYTIHEAALERAAGAAYVTPVSEHDSNSYANLTQSILQGHFAEPGERYEYFHTPGYPAFAAVILFVTHSYFAVTFVQILLIFATAAMTYLLGERLASASIGRWASLVFLVHPLVVLIGLAFLTDILFTFLITAGFTFIVLRFTKKPLTTVLASAIVFSAAIYVRPIGFIAFPVFVAPLLALTCPWRKKIAYAALMLVVISVLLLPWMLRNKERSGVFAFTSLVSFNMSFYNIPHFWASKGIPLDQAIKKVESDSGVPMGLDQNGYPANWYDLASSPKLSAFYMHTIFASPVHYMLWHLYNSSGFFFNVPVSPPHLSKNIKALIASGDVAEALGAIVHPWWFLAERVAVGLGLISLYFGFWRMRRSMLAWTFAFVILYLAALGGPSSQARYRLPVEPLLAIFMMSGLAQIADIWKHSRQKK